MTTPNPPISGHHLINEGHVFHRWDGRTGEQIWTGGCLPVRCSSARVPRRTFSEDVAIEHDRSTDG